MQKKLLVAARGLKPACKRSILAEFEDQIQELRAQKYSYRQIAILLAQIGVKTTWQNVQDFNNRHAKKEKKEFKKVKKERDEIKPSFCEKDGIEKPENNSSKTSITTNKFILQGLLNGNKN